MKRNYLLTFFAVFAAAIMLMTTTIAGPIREQEDASIISNVEEDLTKSIEKLCLKIEDDQELLYLMDKLTGDDEGLNLLASSIENTDDTDEKRYLINEYKDIIENKEGFDEIQQYFSNKYSEDIQTINNQVLAYTDFSEIEDIVNSKLETIPESDFEIEAHLPLAGAIYSADDSTSTIQFPTMGEIESVNGMEYQDWYTPNDGGDDSLYDQVEDPLEAQWGGFLRNLDGSVYVPGYGWVYPSDDNWGFWLEIEDYLKTLPVGYATEVLGQIVSILNDYGPTGPIWNLILEIINEIILSLIHI